MAITDGSKSITVTEFSGSKPLLDIIDITTGDAQLAQNCEYVPGGVKVRRGFKSKITLSTGAVSLHFWEQSSAASQAIRYLAWGQANSTNRDIVIYNLDANTSSIVGTYGGASSQYITYAEANPRLYMAAFNAFNVGVGGGLVWDGNAAHTADATFQRPMKTTEVTLALTQPNAGLVTAGDHYAGLLFQTRNGYWTKPGPCDSSIKLVPVKITSTGGKTITCTATPSTTWPPWITNIQLIITTTLNSFQYYVVPGTITPVTAGGAGAATIEFNVADLQLRSVGSQGAGTLADDYFGLLSMDGSNNPPFNPKNVLAWGNRIVWFGNYGGVDSFFPSDPLNYEWISPDQHIQQLPGGINIGGAFVLRGVLYVLSDAGGMYAYRDNGGRPVTFQPPQLIDGRISVNSPYLVSVSSGGTYAVIAGTLGVYVYSGGSFPSIPMSYYQGLTGPGLGGYFPYTVKDFRDQQIILVQDGYGNIHVFDYSNAPSMEPSKIKYSLWRFDGNVGNIGSMELVKEPSFATASGVWTLYYVDNGTATILRLKSIPAGDSATTMYSDEIGAPPVARGIDWKYQTSPLPENDEGSVLEHIACRIRAKSLQSTGSLTISAINLDGTSTVVPAASPIALSSAPGQEYLAVYDMQQEFISYLFTNGAAINNGISISRFTHFYNLIAEQR